MRLFDERVYGAPGHSLNGIRLIFRRDTFDQLDQTVRVFVAVVHAVQHDIFKGDPLGVRHLWIVAQGLQQHLEGSTFC